MKEFTVATRVITGLGSVSALPDELQRCGAERIVVVADRGIEGVGLLDRILCDVPSEKVAVQLLIDPNPDVCSVENSASQARAANGDVVLAIGGGSALGAAKAIAIRLTNPGRIAEYVGVGQVRNTPAPTIAVATTAGSGSEVSTVLVLHEEGRAEELVVRSPGCEPKVAILDGTVLRDLPWAPPRFCCPGRALALYRIRLGAPQFLLHRSIGSACGPNNYRHSSPRCRRCIFRSKRGGQKRRHAATTD